jgi:hypothetical protein
MQLIIFLTAFMALVVNGQTCPILNELKVRCRTGFGTEEACIAAGCCWDDVSGGKRMGVPNCFLKTPISPPSSPPLSPEPPTSPPLPQVDPVVNAPTITNFVIETTTEVFESRTSTISLPKSSATSRAPKPTSFSESVSSKTSSSGLGLGAIFGISLAGIAGLTGLAIGGIILYRRNKVDKNSLPTSLKYPPEQPISPCRSRQSDAESQLNTAYSPRSNHNTDTYSYPERVSPQDQLFTDQSLYTQPPVINQTVKTL